MWKVVIDTNLLIDGAEDFYNYGNRIIDLVIAGQIQAYANHSTFRENKFIANKKIPDEGYLRKLEYFYSSIKPVPNIQHLNIVEDREDNKILESAVACQADFLISSDRHLLKIHKYKGIRIVTPVEFWNIYEEETGSAWQLWLRNFIN